MDIGKHIDEVDEDEEMALISLQELVIIILIQKQRGHGPPKDAGNLKMARGLQRTQDPVASGRPKEAFMIHVTWEL